MRAELGAAAAQTSRIAARLSPLAGAPVAGRLSGEGDRAMLVPVPAISAAGVVPVAPVPAGPFDEVRLVSGARSSTTQWRVRLATRDPFARTKLSAAYTLTTGRERSLAIASPVGAPGFVAGPLSAGGRHTVAFSIGEWIGDAEIRLAGIARSGVRFTPLADRDLNGDGRINDAAYVPQDESGAWAAAVSPGVRGCVRAAAGRIAAMNSCTGPWTLSSLLVASVPANRFGFRSGSMIDVQLSNPLAAIARVSGVTFGDVAVVDPVLVHVTGFDSTAQRFRGVPLQRFGTPTGLSPGLVAPVRLAVSVRVPFGPSVTSQRADAALSALARDTSGRALRGAAMQYFGDLPPIPIVVLQSAEGIQLTADQRGMLQALAGRWQEAAIRTVASATRRDSAPEPSAAAIPAPRERLVDARAIFLLEAQAIAAEVRQLLSADQIDLLPEGVQRLLNPRFLRFLALQDAATM